jgi:WD40 repeat protein
MRIRMSDLEAVLRRVPVLGVVVLLAGVLGGCAGGPLRPGFQSPPATPTPPASPPQTPTPPPKPTLPAEPTWTPPPTKGPMTPTPVALCAFGPPAPPEPGPSLEAYVFSEPSVVLTHTSGIAIVGWLPDGQQILIIRTTLEDRDYIETFNVQTRQIQRYAERHSYSISPGTKLAWLSSPKAVAFVDRTANGQDVLRISWGEGMSVREVGSNLTTFLAASPDGNQVLFFSWGAKQPQVYNLALDQTYLLPFFLPILSPQDLLALGQIEGPIPYQAIWHPNGDRIGFYNDTGFYLANLITGQICEINLGPHVDGKRWAVEARWSPDGRYLAARTTVGDPVVQFIDLTLIDTITGEQRHLDLGRQYISDMTWAPNSRDLLVAAESDDHIRDLLYLVDAVTGDSRQILVNDSFVAAGYWGIAWSPTGQTIAVPCSTLKPSGASTEEGRVCTITVEVRQ